MQTCKRCLEIYQDSAISRGIWISEAPAFDSTEALIEAGRSVVTDQASIEADSGETRRFRKGPWYRNSRRLGFAAVCAVVVLVAAMWLYNFNREMDSGLSPEIIKPVRIAVEKASQWGPFVLPGGEQSLNQTGDVYRSGYVPLNDSLKLSLEHLLRLFQEGDYSPDVACWLIAGYVATGQIDAARDLVPGARNLHPDDSRITALEALITYIDGDFEKSTALLYDVLDSSPDDAVAGINLAIILSKQDNNDEARKILNRIRQRHAGTPFADRADSLLLNLKGP